MDPTSKRHRINYQVVFGEQGIELTMTEVAETQISTSKALQVLLKYMMIKSISFSNQIIAKNAITWVTSKLNFPDMKSFENKNWQELRNLTIIKVEWNDCYSLGFTLYDGQSCIAGTKVFTKSHIFDPYKKITNVVVIMENNESNIMRINFNSDEEILTKVGADDGYVERYGGRVEKFEIAADEQLIGCKLDAGDSYLLGENCFAGVTWVKMKVPNIKTIGS